MGEFCENCNEEHPTLEEVLPKQKFRHRLLWTGFILSLVGFLLTIYMLLDVYGGMAVFTLYAIYFFKENLMASVETLNMLNQAAVVKNHEESNGDQHHGHGHYL